MCGAENIIPNRNKKMMLALFPGWRPCEGGPPSGIAGGRSVLQRSRETTKGQGPNVMHTFRCVPLSVLMAFLLTLGLGACSRTWEGLKEDTGENLQTTGQSLEKAGEDIKKQAQ
jgi:hypothetical protein